MAIEMNKDQQLSSNAQKVFPGKVFGRWTVLDSCTYTETRQKKWLCRCDCGTERYVLDRSLRYGASKSCGCLKRERAIESNAHNLDGKQFGDLTVLHRTDRKYGGNIYWLCRCSCGKELEVQATHLVCGRKTSCGCKTEHNYASIDISGKKFYRLKALYPTEMRNNHGSVIWHCRCDCGNEVDVPYNSLVYSNMKSCGCQKKENDQRLQENLSRVDGTSIDHLRSKVIFSNNTTGVKGVYYVRGKYQAKIVFQQKAYYLGSYETLEEAAAVRKCAEEAICDRSVDFYDKWKAKADADPAWAEANPIKFSVAKINGQLYLNMLPNLS